METRKNKRKSNVADLLGNVEDESVKRILTSLVKKNNESRERLDLLETANADHQAKLDLLETANAELSETLGALKAENAELHEKLTVVTNQLDDQQSVGASASAMVPLCEKAPTVMVNPVKLALCESDDWSSCVHKLVTCVFTVSEIYRRNVRGGKATVSVPDKDDLMKVAIDQVKLNAIHQFVKAKFNAFYEANKTNNRWTAQVNKTLNSRLGTLNRHFRLLIRVHQGEEITEKEKEKYSISRSDQTMFREYEDYKRDPAKFAELDTEINRMLAELSAEPSAEPLAEP